MSDAEIKSVANRITMMIRMFEYDMQIALKTAGSYTPGELRVEMPKSGILFLRCSDSTPDEMVIKMLLPDGNEVSYVMPVLKFRKYDINIIFEKGLYFLVPFYLFNLEKKFKAVESGNEDEDREFREEITRLRDRLNEEYKSSRIDAYTYRSIVDLFNKVSTALTKGKNHVYAETEAIMGGKVLEYEAKSILTKGITQGITQGISQGEISGGNKMLYELVADGTITKEKAAEKAKISVEEFVKNMTACGYKTP